MPLQRNFSGFCPDFYCCDIEKRMQWPGIIPLFYLILKANWVRLNESDGRGLFFQSETIPTRRRGRLLRSGPLTHGVLKNNCFCPIRRNVAFFAALGRHLLLSFCKYKWIMPSAIKGSGKHWTFKKEKEKSGKQRWRDIYKSISRPYVVIFF